MQNHSGFFYRGTGQMLSICSFLFTNEEKSCTLMLDGLVF